MTLLQDNLIVQSQVWPNNSRFHPTRSNHHQASRFPETLDLAIRGGVEQMYRLPWREFLCLVFDLQHRGGVQLLLRCLYQKSASDLRGSESREHLSAVQILWISDPSHVGHRDLLPTDFSLYIGDSGTKVRNDFGREVLSEANPQAESHLFPG